MTKKKKYKAYYYSPEHSGVRFDGDFCYKVADFYGIDAMKHARAHAKMLNALPRKDQP